MVRQEKQAKFSVGGRVTDKELRYTFTGGSGNDGQVR